MSFIVPKKPQILYSPMLSSFGGGSARGFNPGGGAPLGLDFQFLTTTSVGQVTTTISGLGSGTVGYALMGGGGSGGASHYPGGGAGQILYGSYSHPGGDIVVAVGGRSGKLLNNGTQTFNGWSPDDENAGGRFGYNTTITHSGSTVVARAWGGGGGGGHALPYDATLDGGVNTAITGAERDEILSNYYTEDTTGGSQDGAFLVDPGGNESLIFGSIGARGSSGGGGGGNSGSGGNGGQGGNNGSNGATYNGGSGMGTSDFNTIVSSIQTSLQTYSGSGSATAGQGGAGNGSGGTHQGGGGAGGLEFYSLSGVSNPNASAGTNSSTTPGSGGAGFGSGGGASGYSGSRGSTGEGAQGFAILWEIP